MVYWVCVVYRVYRGNRGDRVHWVYRVHRVHRVHKEGESYKIAEQVEFVCRVSAWSRRIKQCQFSDLPHGAGHLKDATCPYSIFRYTNFLNFHYLNISFIHQSIFISMVHQQSNTPLLHYSITPLLQYSNTPLLHYSITPFSIINKNVFSLLVAKGFYSFHPDILCIFFQKYNFCVIWYRRFVSVYKGSCHKFHPGTA